MNREEKDFFEKNKNWIYIIILSIFVTHIEYINMFENVIFNGIANIIFGAIVIILLYLFINEAKGWIDKHSKFYSFLIKTLIIFGVISSFYHIGYAIGQIMAVL